MSPKRVKVYGCKQGEVGKEELLYEVVIHVDLKDRTADRIKQCISVGLKTIGLSPTSIQLDADFTVELM